MQNIFEQLKELLKKDERFVSQDGLLLKNQAQELARKNDSNLIKLLFSDEAIKKHFFFKIDEVLIFDKEKFIRFVSNKQFLPDSYTAFKNKIGFITGNEYLSENKEVVLVWPYKDCVLEGGMTKEDQKRDEIFYNETLAPDDITFLLDPKVFTNFKRIGMSGVASAKAMAAREHKLDGFKRDEKGNIKDNFIIKGNNLLALVSLKKEFAGKVKLIYIDPPYNTGNDGFKYNDSFNHSSWLTFMKNRLEIAKTLLSDDGVIFVQCDDNEQAYLKVMMDEIFGRENFICNFIWKSKSGGANDSRFIAVDHEYTACYGKNSKNLYFNLDKDANVSTSYNLEDENGEYSLDRLDKQSLGYIRSLDFPIFDKNGNKYEVEHKNPKEKIARWRWSKETVNEHFDELVFKNGKVYTKNYKKEGAIPRSLLVDERFSRTRTGKTEHFKLFNEYLFNNPKPENLLKFFIEISTKPKDLILDFFAGSGTTLAVAHKMGRQYIGIEQMDYIHDLPESRLKKVIAGEQGGISKAVNWKGGGEFVYMELARWNELIVERIEEAKTGPSSAEATAGEEQLAALCEELKENTFLSWKIDPETMMDAKAKAFADLSIADKKKFLIEILDKNQLYVNLSEIRDKEYEVSDEDMKLNYEFYGKN